MFPAGSNGEPARMLKCKKLKNIPHSDKRGPCDYAIIGKKKFSPAVTDGVTATMLKFL